uniref:Uncharacterized protein n=1 Tax=Avena sativa TaxID=4498 RepID=A0ACD5UE58_AVESA
MARPRARARAGGAAGEIPDELLQDVFARLPGLRDLLRCAATSKRWLRLVAERGFLRRLGLWPDTSPHPSVLVGVFSQNSYACKWSCFERSNLSPRPPQFLSLQPGDDGARHTFDSFFAGHDVLFNFARPLASRRGLLLARVWRPDSDSGRVEPVDHKFQLAVCRPMGDNTTKQSTHLLPTPAFDMIGFGDHDFTGEALLTDADYGGGGGNGGNFDRQGFRVVLNYTDRDGFASPVRPCLAAGV